MAGTCIGRTGRDLRSIEDRQNAGEEVTVFELHFE
jgi:hypothetical protein